MNTQIWPQTLAVAAFLFLAHPQAFAQTYMGGDDPTIPAVAVGVLPNFQATKEAKRANFDALEGDMKKAHADLSALDAQLHPLRVQKRGLVRQLHDPKADADTKKQAREALDELDKTMKPMEEDYGKKVETANQLCMKQYSDDYSSFYQVDDQEKQDYNKAGFSCASGETLVADTARKQAMVCGMQVQRIGGGVGFGAGASGWAAGSGNPYSPYGGGICGAPGGMMLQPTRKLACINEKKRVVGSALFYQVGNAKYVSNNARFNFDDQGRVRGWKSSNAGVTTEVTLKGDKIEKKTSVGETEISHCEWLTGTDFEKYYSEGGPIQYKNPSVKPSNLTQ